MTELSAYTLADFVEAVGEDHPTPGCGGAAALALALAAACARKAFVISARKHGGDPALHAAAERCQAISAAALAGIERDAVDFRALLHAAPSDAAPAQALERDAQTLLTLAVDLRELLGEHAARIDALMAGDAVAALALCEAFERVERHNLAEL